MKLIRIDRRRLSRRILNQMVAVLRDGAVVAYPTDTAYGLAADSANPEALSKIYAIKGREKGKPLPLIAGSSDQARRHAKILGKSLILAKKYWPGPLTIVCPTGATQAYSTCAVRVPRSLWARSLAAALGRPITSTSANLSGRPAPYSGAAVEREFLGRKIQPDVVLDAGRLPKRPVSTIVKVVRGKITVLRQGAIVLKQKV
jgi:L-threonylcarbamoyladenylate synthase